MILMVLVNFCVRCLLKCSDLRGQCVTTFSDKRNDFFALCYFRIHSFRTRRRHHQIAHTVAAWIIAMKMRSHSMPQAIGNSAWRRRFDSIQTCDADKHNVIISSRWFIATTRKRNHNQFKFILSYFRLKINWRENLYTHIPADGE